MKNNIFKDQRKSFLAYDETYFWTCTINNWMHLLKTVAYKMIIINSLKKLIEKNLIEVYAYVIMPNHIHLIIRLVKPNGKEKPSSSFLKETSHELRKAMMINNLKGLSYFKVSESDRNFRIWRRDSLAIEMFNLKILEQKLTYIHDNPLQEHWQLSKEPKDYYWSSANYYENGIDDFKIIKDYRDYF